MPLFGKRRILIVETNSRGLFQVLCLRENTERNEREENNSKTIKQENVTCNSVAGNSQALYMTYDTFISHLDSNF